MSYHLHPSVENISAVVAGTGPTTAVQSKVPSSPRRLIENHFPQSSGFLRNGYNSTKDEGMESEPSHTCRYTSRWFKVLDEGVLCPSDLNENNSHLLRLVVSSKGL